ncbi:MAG TPA: primosomal protein N', partial [Candidatus Marinimicrobia bacterium]|nr:primosomal protein N' [Candidatus Neomarinimicrobiota bacterium]
MMVKVCEIAFPVDVMQTFTYLVPDSLSIRLKPGCRVIAPFGSRRQQGYCVSISHNPLDDYKRRLKEISEIRDEEPLFTNAQLELFRWMSDYYMAPAGLVFRAAHPSESGFKKVICYFPAHDYRNDPDVLSLDIPAAGLSLNHIKTYPLDKKNLFNELVANRKILPDNVFSLERSIRSIRAVRLSDPYKKVERESHSRVLNFLKSQSVKEISVSQLMKETGVSRSVIQTMVKNDLLRSFNMEVSSDPFSSGYEPKVRDIKLTAEQKNVIETVISRFDSFYPVLLHGITGSGKTEVYIHLAREALSRGKQALILVPEIAITPHVAGRFRSVFGDKVAIWHSRMSPSERIWTWHMIRRGAIQVVVGARSALFSPFQNPGLIVVDEEHDASYKQHEQAPGYHGRDSAVYYAKLLNIPVILGSATPSMESWYLAQTKKFHLLTLKERFGQAGYPEVRTIDMRKKNVEDEMFSPELIEELRDCLKRNEQAIVLLNRRGYHTFARCSQCGTTLECPHCSVSMTWHKPYNQLICHYCDHHENVPVKCPACGEKKIKIAGSGTQRVEDEISKRIAKARVIRMDLDSTRDRHAHVKILNAFEKHSYDILVGTQMVSKGLDFSNVTLVCIINADTGLGIPDFRSAEKVWQLVSQVAGRSGRGTLAGRVIIQSWLPEHPAVELAARLDVTSFYKQELERRAQLLYPPFSRLILIRVSGKSRERVMAGTGQIGDICKRYMPGEQVLGPSSALVEKVKEVYRWQILLKFKRNEDQLMKRMKKILIDISRDKRNKKQGLSIL